MRSRIKDLAELDRYIEERPARLGCWRSGSPARYGTLLWLNRHAFAEMEALARDVGRAAAMMLAVPAHHNQVGIAAGWVTRYMREARGGQGDMEQDRIALFRTAGAYWTLRNLLAEVRAGARTFEANGPIVRLPYAANREIDALDRMFDLVERLDELQRVEGVRLPQRSASQSIRGWLRAEGADVPWSAVPDWAKHEMRHAAALALSTMPHLLPADFKLAGISMSDYDAIWNELMAWGIHMSVSMMHGSCAPSVAAPILRTEELVETLAAGSGVSSSAVSMAVDLLTLDLEVCPDGALTPLVPVDGRLVPMSTVIIYTSPHRNLIARLHSAPSLMGEVGRALGEAGERATEQVLTRLRGDVKLARRVRLWEPNRRPAGDFDVAACDPDSKLLVIFEVRWAISADGNEETYKLERIAIEKRDQVARLRDSYLAGKATPRWPSGWPDVSEYEVRWFILTRDVLPTRNWADAGITIRSTQLLGRMLRPGASLRELVSLLDDPPMPPAALCDTEWERLRYGDISVEFEIVRAA